MDNESVLIRMAWKARENAFSWKSGTKVGCAIWTKNDKILQGWNIEGLWMTSIHAEVTAITQLMPLNQKIKMMAIVAETKMFTPCGACLDWIFQFSVKMPVILIDNQKEIKRFSLDELMPHYPIK